MKLLGKLQSSALRENLRLALSVLTYLEKTSRGGAKAQSRLRHKMVNVTIVLVAYCS